jgi:hypothetical protein
MKKGTTRAMGGNMRWEMIQKAMSSFFHRSNRNRLKA